MTICGKPLEYIDEYHIYVYDGLLLPSITQILKCRFGNKYNGIDKRVLQSASEKGTAVHRAIEMYERSGEESELPELRNYQFLKSKIGFECVENELPVVLFDNQEPIACGRLDMVIRKDESIGLADIKRTSNLDKNYLFYQLNLYRIAYQQCYGEKVKFLAGLHLREDVRRYVEIPINEEMAKEILTDYKGSVKDEQG